MGLNLESKDLLCRRGCGFFGNPEWKWYCSKCWREVKSGNKLMLSNHDARKDEDSFSKFEDKKKRQTLDRANNIKQIFRNGTHFKDSSLLSYKEIRSSELSRETKNLDHKFVTFLSQRLDRKGITEISRRIMFIIEDILKMSDVTPIEDISNKIQEFYRNLLNQLEHHSLFHALSEEDRIEILNYAEKYITSRCHNNLFCPSTTDDEAKDLELQNRIRGLNWISTSDLKCSILENSQDVRDLLYASINDILEVDSQITPQEKMECLVRCSQNILQMLQISNNSPASADDFLPCLIYVCLKANPPRIQSNINYITRFCNENKIRMGEAGYYFANLCCAMSYIDTLNAQSLGIPEKEFNSYVSGESIPPGSGKNSLLNCEGLQVLSKNLKTLSSLKARHDVMINEIGKLEEKMEKFKNFVCDEVAAVLSRTQYTIKGRETQEEFGASYLPTIIPNLLTSKNTGDENCCISPNVSAIGLEDYLNVSSNENDSVLSLDISNTEENEKESSQEFKMNSSLSLPTSSHYRGFSLQSSTIPNISCENTIENSTKE